jgi:hypothetical protein
LPTRSTIDGVTLAVTAGIAISSGNVYCNPNQVG